MEACFGDLRVRSRNVGSVHDVWGMFHDVQGELETSREPEEGMVVRLKNLSEDGALGKYNNVLATVVDLAR